MDESSNARVEVLWRPGCPFAEEVDPASGEQLGNTPQAFSHIGLVNAAWSIHRAERQANRQLTILRDSANRS